MSKYRMFYQVILCIIGIFLFILGCLEKIDTFWSSIGFALIFCSFIRVFREVRMRKNPEYAREVLVAQVDERNIEISEKAASLTFRLSIFLFCIVEIILFALGFSDIGTILGCAVAFLLTVYWLSWWYYNKKI